MASPSASSETPTAPPPPSKPPDLCSAAFRLSELPSPLPLTPEAPPSLSLAELSALSVKTPHPLLCSSNLLRRRSPARPSSPVPAWRPTHPSDLMVSSDPLRCGLSGSYLDELTHLSSQTIDCSFTTTETSLLAWSDLASGASIILGSASSLWRALTWAIVLANAPSSFQQMKSMVVSSQLRTKETDFSISVLEVYLGAMSISMGLCLCLGLFLSSQLSVWILSNPSEPPDPPVPPDPALFNQGVTSRIFYCPIRLKPTAPLPQAHATSGLISVLSWKLLDWFEPFGRVEFELAPLSQIEDSELLSSSFHITCLLICGTWQTLPLYEDLLLLYEDLLPLYEDLLPLYEDSLPQYEDLLPLYEVVTKNLYSLFVPSFALLVLLPHDAGLHFKNMGVVFTIANLRSSISDSVRRMWKVLLSQIFSRLRISSQFLGSSRRCFVISIAKFLAASFALVAEVCSGNVSPSVLSFSQDFISLSTVNVIIPSCLSGLYVFIFYDYVSRFAFVAAVDYASLAIVFCFLNFCSMVGE